MLLKFCIVKSRGFAYLFNKKSRTEKLNSRQTKLKVTSRTSEMQNYYNWCREVYNLHARFGAKSASSYSCTTMPFASIMQNKSRCHKQNLMKL